MRLPYLTREILFIMNVVNVFRRCCRVDNPPRFLAASALTLTAVSYNRAADKPNEKIRLAVMGLRIARGKQLLPGFVAVAGVEISHVIDPDPAMVKPRARYAEESRVASGGGNRTSARCSIRRMVTAVAVCAPDYWHALATIWAAERGKHVYVEKPVSHNLIEGRRMVEAARKYKVNVQAGTQRRSQASAERRT